MTKKKLYKLTGEMIEYYHAYVYAENLDEAYALSDRVSDTFGWIRSGSGDWEENTPQEVNAPESKWVIDDDIFNSHWTEEDWTDFKAEIG